MLTPKQRAFVSEYLVDLNGTQAAIRAGYSARTANRTASDLLSKPDIAAEIHDLFAAREKRLELKQDRVVLELLRLAMANMGDYVSWGTDVESDDEGRPTDHHSYVRIVPSEDLSQDQLAAVQEVSEVRRPDGTVEVKFKLHDKCGALNSLAKHLGMFIERHKVDGDLTYTIKLPGDFQKAAPGTGNVLHD